MTSTPDPRRRFLRPRSVLAVLLSAVALAAGVAVAQDDTESEPFVIRIGMILPVADAAEEDLAGQLDASVRTAADQAIEMASDEFGFNASVLGFELDVRVAEAGGPDAAAAAAQRLIDEDVLTLAGGYGRGVAEAIAGVAEAEGVPFLNIGSPAVDLRNERCSAAMFHIAPSGGMYLDAIAGWYVGAGFREWYLVVSDDDEGAAIEERFRRTLRERHFGARIAGATTVEGDDVTAAAEAAVDANADVVFVILSGPRQLAFLEAAQAAGLETETTAFPWPETQSRDFYARALEAAPDVGAGRRASAWEPTLDAYGARELNARYRERFDRPMDAAAWASYQAIKLTFEAVGFGGVRDREALRAHFTSDDAVFDVWKGIGVTFRPWNHQMRQTLFLVELRPEAETAWDRALLVGELPSIYMPRTDPIERLDQLGDLEGPSRCSF